MKKKLKKYSCIFCHNSVQRMLSSVQVYKMKLTYNQIYSQITCMLFMASRPDKKKTTTTTNKQNSKAHKVFLNSPYQCNYNYLFNIIKLKFNSRVGHHFSEKPCKCFSYCNTISDLFGSEIEIQSVEFAAYSNFRH